MELIKGIPVSPGIAIGRALVLEQSLRRVPHRILPEEDVPAELLRLEDALAGACEDLEAHRDRAEATLGREPAKIFEYHLGLLRDPTLIDPIRERISKERVTAAFAVADEFARQADRFLEDESPEIHRRAQDFVGIEDQLMGHLMGRSSDRISRLEEPAIIVAHELSPGQVMALESRRVLGLVTDMGGRTDHTSIVAGAMGPPVVVGCSAISPVVDDGDLVIVDGRSGEVVVRPDDETLARWRRAAVSLATRLETLVELAPLESVTTDGTRIELMGNIEYPHEIGPLLECGGDGVGLYRTEFLYLDSRDDPTEEALSEEYRLAVKHLEGRPLTIRTVDLGADKHTQRREIEPERNPFLGLRSIRYCLQHLDLFRTQLRAILRASAHGPLRIMFPLITAMSELRQARMVLEDVMEDCRDEGIPFDENIPVGIMIEVPSAALMATTFAREVAFFSIGTNDLIQYTVAVDRGNERVASLYSAANPAVVKLVKNVIREQIRDRDKPLR